MRLQRRTARPVLLGALVLTVGLAGCAGADATSADDDESEVARVGVAMPTQQLERWAKDAANVTAQLEGLGHDVLVEYADDDPQLQVEQIGQMVEEGVDALIVGAVDASALSSVLAEAGAAEIPVIAYDRLILDTPDIDYYATFDNERVGIQQATSLLQGLGVLDEAGRDTRAKGPFFIELFAGSPDDNNAHVFFAGAMSVLQPYLDSGVLKVVSGETDFDAVATPAWDGETAAARMSTLAQGYGPDQQLHGVLSPNDGIAQAVLGVFASAGIDAGGRDLPVVTGQDADLASAQSVAAGEQYTTIFKDTRQLAEVAVSAVHKMLTGEEPETNDVTTYENGRITVPSYLLTPQLVTQDNYEHLLIESGYYEAGDLA
ncbi:sugar-binding protein [Georgenia phoenicis]|uniref:substrate-binding domain-containing protein n=1 Tax=unclassified Georgenia TaxID=2626815 RepID=UPI0039AF47B1